MHLLLQTDLSTSTADCGTCGKTCTPANAEPGTCSAGVCSTLQCKAGFANCNGNDADGCEVSLANREAAASGAAAAAYSFYPLVSKCHQCMCHVS
jgi:hypothetical protein